MPIPKPKTGESKREFISRCVGDIAAEYKGKQAVAICYSQWRDRQKKKVGVKMKGHRG